MSGTGNLLTRYRDTLPVVQALRDAIAERQSELDPASDRAILFVALREAAAAAEAAWDALTTSNPGKRILGQLEALD